jgi:VIT1/CCC1 family predicted Fe2+/Mn2+ transporter
VKGGFQREAPMFASHSNSHPATLSAHTPEAVRSRLQEPPQHSYLRDLVYGAVDGTVTTFAVVSGVAGAQLAPRIVVVMGLANVVADGFSMAIGNFLATRAERQLTQRARRMEEQHVDRVPTGEREEVRQIYAGKGFAGDDLERAVTVITSDRRRWVETMLREELGLSTEGPSPARAAVATFAAFIVAGFVPLLPFIAEFVHGPGRFEPFRFSVAMTALAFFAIGMLKSRFVEQPWYRGGLEVLGVGGGAAMLSYGVGLLMKNVGVP